MGGFASSSRLPTRRLLQAAAPVRDSPFPPLPYRVAGELEFWDWGGGFRAQRTLGKFPGKKMPHSLTLSVIA